MEKQEVKTKSHEWGNYPKNFTPKMYWGARAILERVSGQPGKSLDLLPDRQSFERLDGSQRDQDAFFDWINKKALPELRRHARENRFQRNYVYILLKITVQVYGQFPKNIETTTLIFNLP